MLSSICQVRIQLGILVLALNVADYYVAPTRKYELDGTDHTDHTDHTHQEYISLP